MNKILLYDTSIASDNLGDQVVMDYCRSALKDIFSDAFFWETATHEKIGKRTYKMNEVSDYRFLCGTNLLRGDMLKRKQWKIGVLDAGHLKEICMMGVGWNNYNQEKVDAYTKYIYRQVFHKSLIHSVRDSNTGQRLREIGIENVINTACPTMWRLTRDFCAEIPVEKAGNVLTTLTNYRQNEELDRKLLEILEQRYQKVFFWIQCYKDLDYLKKIFDISRLEIIHPALGALDHVLETERDLDYVGTRLHCGIRCLNYKKRTIIVGVDNRAAEIAKDTNLTVVPREHMERELPDMLERNCEMKLHIPMENIAKWKAQF